MTASQCNCVLLVARGLSGDVCWVWETDIPAAGFGRHVPNCRQELDATATSGTHLSPTNVSATRDRVLPASAGSDAPISDGVLLTGATGFVGMELLTRYLERTDRRVYALVRGTNERDVIARVEHTLRSLFGADHPYARRVVAVRGDITRPDLGRAS